MRHTRSWLQVEGGRPQAAQTATKCQSPLQAVVYVAWIKHGSDCWHQGGPALGRSLRPRCCRDISMPLLPNTHEHTVEHSRVCWCLSRSWQLGPVVCWVWYMHKRYTYCPMPTKGRYESCRSYLSAPVSCSCGSPHAHTPCSQCTW